MSTGQERGRTGIRLVGVAGPASVIFPQSGGPIVDSHTDDSYSVIILAPWYPPYAGGSSVVFENLVANFGETNMFFVITAHHRDEPLIELVDGNYIYRVLPRYEWIPSPVQAVLEIAITTLLAVFLYLLRDPDGFHAHSTSYATAGIAIASRLTGLPICYDCRDLDFPKRLVTAGFPVRWLSASPSVDEKLHSSGVPIDQIIRVPIINPPLVESIADRDIDSSQSFEVIFVGRLREQKGIRELLDAFGRHLERHPDSLLTIIGSGPMEPVVRARIEEISGENIRYLGRLSHQKTLERILAADVLVNPSVRETGPRTVLEAVELETAVVSTAVGLVPELLLDGESGLLVERDPQEVMQALDYLAENPERRAELATNAKDAYNSADWAGFEERILEAYGAYSTCSGVST